jgi:hypothetical protein
MDRQAKIRQMLGGKTPAEFAKLQPERRKAVLRRHLVQEQLVAIEEGDDDDECNPKIANGVILRQEYYMGDDEAGKQLVKEAREIFYAENTFTVRSHWLCEFVRDTLADGEPMAIEPLVRRIQVRVDIEHIHDSDNFVYMPEGETEKSWVVRDLRQLLEFKNAEWIGIQVQGKGALDGSDLKTQQKIQEMAGIVKQLIDQFGTAVTILKVAPGKSLCHNLRPYWNPPSAASKKKFQVGKASFEELMQIQIEEWTRVIPEVFDPNNYWESLL